MPVRKSRKKKTIKRKTKPKRNKLGQILPGYTGNPIGKPTVRMTQTEVFQELLASKSIKIELEKTVEMKTPIRNEKTGKINNWNTDDIVTEKKTIEYNTDKDIRTLIFCSLLELMLQGGRNAVMAARELLIRGDGSLSDEDKKKIDDMTDEEIEQEIKEIERTRRKLIPLKKTAS
jgi:hypothetical protein